MLFLWIWVIWSDKQTVKYLVGTEGPVTKTQDFTPLFSAGSCNYSPLFPCCFLSLLQQGGGVEMRLHRVLLAACVNCTRMYRSCGGNFYPRRLYSSASTFTSRRGGTHPFTLYRTLNVPFRNGKLGFCNRSYGDFGLNTLCSQTQLVSRCQTRSPAVVRKENLLQAGATWPGKNQI